LGVDDWDFFWILTFVFGIYTSSPFIFHYPKFAPKIGEEVKIFGDNIMERLIIDGFGKFVGKEGSQLVVKESGKVVYRTLAESLRQVIISGGGSIGFEAMSLLAEHGVDLIIFNWKGDITARLSSLEMRTVQTRKQQYYAYLDTRSGTLAKMFVWAKLKNQYALLGTFAKVRKETRPDKAEELLKNRDEINFLISTLETVLVKPIEELRETIIGLEGKSAVHYWKGFGNAIPDKFNFSERSGRHAQDVVNAMLNYGYGILEGEIWRAVHFAGLDPYGGYLHADRPGKPSMVLDLMEEFRQQVVDKSVLALLSKNMVKPSDFTVTEGLCRLSDNARKAEINEIVGKLEEYVRVGNEKVRWCDLMLSQARTVAKFLRGETSEYKPFYLRW